MIGWRETLQAVLFMVICCVLAVALAVCIIVVTESQKCAAMQELNPEYSFRNVDWVGCMMQTPKGIWLPVNNYTVID